MGSPPAAPDPAALARLWGLYLGHRGVVVLHLTGRCRYGVLAAARLGRCDPNATPAAVAECLADAAPHVLRSLAAWERDRAAAAAAGRPPPRPSTCVGWGVRAWAKDVAALARRRVRLAADRDYRPDAVAAPEPAADEPTGPRAAATAAAVAACVAAMPPLWQAVYRATVAGKMTPGQYAARCRFVSKEHAAAVRGWVPDRLRAIDGGESHTHRSNR